MQVTSGEDGKKTLVGYAAVFYRADDPGTEYRFKMKTKSGGTVDVIERIDRRAFDGIQSNPDVRGLFNHDPNAVLGRTGANTMRLAVDEKGLRYEIDLPNTPQANGLADSVSRGDINGSSFSFRVNPNGDKWTAIDKNTEQRTILSASVLDVGPVTFPAYSATTAGTRSEGDVGEADSSYASHRERERAIEVRLRMLELDTEVAM